MTFTVKLAWEHDSDTSFKVNLEGKDYEILSTIMWITRGTLMASNATRATAYNEDGFEAVSYIK